MKATPNEERCRCRLGVLIVGITTLISAAILVQFSSEDYIEFNMKNGVSTQLRRILGVEISSKTVNESVGVCAKALNLLEPDGRIIVINMDKVDFRGRRSTFSGVQSYYYDMVSVSRMIDAESDQDDIDELEGEFKSIWFRLKNKK